MLFLIVILANFAEAITGFGSTVITLTLGARFQPIESLIPVIVPLNLLLSAYLVFKYLSFLNQTILFKKILPIVGLGMAVGISLQSKLQGDGLFQKIFGLLVFIYALTQLILGFKKTQKQTPTAPHPFGSFLLLFSGGIIQGIFASGGPLVVTYGSKVLRDKKQFRTTLSALWLILNLVLTLTFLRQNKITTETLLESAKLLPAILIGLAAGELSHSRISEVYFRRLVFFLLTLAGFALATR